MILLKIQGNRIWDLDFSYYTQNDLDRFQVSATPLAGKMASLIGKETMPFWPSFIRGVSNRM